MNRGAALDYCVKLVPAAYVSQAQNADCARTNRTRQLIQQRKLPERGWNEQQIEMFLMELSLMDSNNFSAHCGIGEREGRVFSDLVARRHYRMAHGVGRSGDLAEPQPKAVGSSLISQLTNQLTADALTIAGLRSFRSCFVVPMATGMTITLCLLALRRRRPTARYVIWPRIDQKSCIKAIYTAGFEPVVVENVLCGDELKTDLDAVKSAIEERGASAVLCILTTTSCFAPRAVDKLCDIARLCHSHDIPHVVNNAYGVQSTKCTHEVNQATRLGRVDVVVQSTDKNFLVPVGGAVVITCSKELGRAIRQTYPGRASLSPSLDLLITLLSMGAAGWRHCLQERRRHYGVLQRRLAALAATHGCRLLSTPNNPISVAMTLPSSGDCGSGLCTPPLNHIGGDTHTLATVVAADAADCEADSADCISGAAVAKTDTGSAVANLAVYDSKADTADVATSSPDHASAVCAVTADAAGPAECATSVDSTADETASAVASCASAAAAADTDTDRSVTQIGSMLFSRLVSGARALSTGQTRTVVDHTFHGWGCHCANYPSPYLTAAASVGVTDSDIDTFIDRLDRVLCKHRRTLARAAGGPQTAASDTAAAAGAATAAATDVAAAAAGGAATDVAAAAADAAAAGADVDAASGTAADDDDADNYADAADAPEDDTAAAADNANSDMVAAAVVASERAG